VSGIARDWVKAARIGRAGCEVAAPGRSRATREAGEGGVEGEGKGQRESFEEAVRWELGRISDRLADTPECV